MQALIIGVLMASRSRFGPKNSFAKPFWAQTGLANELCFLARKKKPTLVFGPEISPTLLFTPQKTPALFIGPENRPNLFSGPENSPNLFSGQKTDRHGVKMALQNQLGLTMAL